MIQAKKSGAERKEAQVRFLEVPEVAEMLSVQPSTIYQWATMGYIPCVRLGPGKSRRSVRFDEQAVLEWVKARMSEGRTSRLPQTSRGV